jgi:hypothetical protein
MTEASELSNNAINDSWFYVGGGFASSDELIINRKARKRGFKVEVCKTHSINLVEFLGLEWLGKESEKPAFITQQEIEARTKKFERASAWDGASDVTFQNIEVAKTIDLSALSQNAEYFDEIFG